MGKCHQHPSIREKRDAEIGNSLEKASKMALAGVSVNLHCISSPQ